MNNNNKEVQNLSTHQLINYLLFLADTNHILSQRNAEWCGHGPMLEQDIALTNITLDLLGQARMFYQYAAELMHTDEDKLAYMRGEREYKNLLITELPKGDWAFTTLRLFFCSSYFKLLYTQLLQNEDERINAISEKALKEVNYHVRWSSNWVLRLGDGTEESNSRINFALKEITPYVGEMFLPTDFEAVATIDFQQLKSAWIKSVNEVLAEATLPAFDENAFAQTGGKSGLHTEHLGYILAEMQYLQRSIPNATW